MADHPAVSRRPWRADKIPGGYVVRDATGQALAYLCSRENEAEARQAKVLTADEARRIAFNVARVGRGVGRGRGARPIFDVLCPYGGGVPSLIGVTLPCGVTP
jgi:hypothetical protein